LAEISTSLEGITTAYAVFNERSEQLAKFPSQEVYDQLHQPMFKRDVEDLFLAIKEHEDEQRSILDSIENGLSENISREVESALRQ